MVEKLCFFVEKQLGKRRTTAVQLYLSRKRGSATGKGRKHLTVYESNAKHGGGELSLRNQKLTATLRGWAGKAEAEATVAPSCSRGALAA